jgi:hypothetical protein
LRADRSGKLVGYGRRETAWGEFQPFRRFSADRRNSGQEIVYWYQLRLWQSRELRTKVQNGFRKSLANLFIDVLSVHVSLLIEDHVIWIAT